MPILEESYQRKRRIFSLSRLQQRKTKFYIKLVKLIGYQQNHSSSFYSPSTHLYDRSERAWWGNVKFGSVAWDRNLFFSCLLRPKYQKIYVDFQGGHYYWCSSWCLGRLSYLRPLCFGNQQWSGAKLRSLWLFLYDGIYVFHLVSFTISPISFTTLSSLEEPELITLFLRSMTSISSAYVPSY